MIGEGSPLRPIVREQLRLERPCPEEQGEAEWQSTSSGERSTDYNKYWLSL